MEVLCRTDEPGALSKENIEKLVACGAQIREREEYGGEESAVILNYHVSRILALREELRSTVSELPPRKWGKKGAKN